MSVTPVKLPQNILIVERRESLDAGVMSGAAVETRMSLAQKLDDYLLRLGYSNAYVLGIVVQLMTQGKVRVEFRDHRERLQLVAPEDLMSRTVAVTMFDSYVTTLTQKDKTPVAFGSGTTQRIVVQGPRK